MPWIIAGGAVGAGLLAGNAAGKAAGAQAGATGEAVAEQRRQYDIGRSDMAPYRDVGSAAVMRISDLLGLGTNTGRSLDDIREELRGSGKYTTQPDGSIKSMLRGEQPITDDAALNQEAQRIFAEQVRSAGAGGGGALNQKFTVADFDADPVTKLSMKYGLDLGSKAIDRGAGAAGMRNSGATLKALTRFGQDYAGSKASDSYNRFYADQDRIFNRLSGVAGTGQTAATNTAAMGANSAQNVGNLITAGGNARGAAAIAQGNAASGALNTIGSYYGQQQMLDKILASRQPQYTGYGAAGDYQYG